MFMAIKISKECSYLQCLNVRNLLHLTILISIVAEFLLQGQVYYKKLYILLVRKAEATIFLLPRLSANNNYTQKRFLYL